MAHPLPLALELPDEALRGAPMEDLPLPGPARPARRVRRLLVRLGIGLLVLVGLAVAAVMWLVPWYVRRECIAQAAEHGVVLSLDDVALESTGFRLLGVHATSPALPGVSVEAPELDVEMNGLQPHELTVRRATLTLAGKWSDNAAAFAKWRASGQGGRGGEWAPESLVAEESRIVWQAPFAENAHVDASNTHLQIAWRSSGTELHARSDAVAVTLPAGTLGPWRVDVDRTATMSRLRVALDPAVPDACTVLVVGDDQRTTSVDVTVPRSPPARLGLSSLLGLKGRSLQVEAAFHYATMGPKRADANGKGGLYGVDAGLPAPLDVTWDLTASGDPTGGLDVKKSHLTAGPLTGAMTGTLKAFDDGFRVDLAWTGGPVPCSAFEAPLGEGSPLDLAYQLRKLAEGTGMARVQGTVRARGTLAFDSRDPASARAQFAPEAGCSVALFGQP
jgi:hypothetical protein